jgi:hypothetical protein
VCGGKTQSQIAVRQFPGDRRRVDRCARASHEQQGVRPLRGRVRAYQADGPRGSSPATAEQQAAFEEERRVWIKATLSQDLTIGAGQIAYEGRDITNGGDLLDLYGGRADVVPMAIALIWMENHLSDAKKKRFRSQLASSLGSLGALPETAPGDAPASTVASADPKDSADHAPATDDQPSELSGTTDPTRATEDLASA